MLRREKKSHEDEAGPSCQVEPKKTRREEKGVTKSYMKKVKKGKTPLKTKDK